MTKSVLVVTSEKIGEKMAGIGLRHWEISHALAKFFNVTLATSQKTSMKSSSIQLVSFDAGQNTVLNRMIKENDVVVSQAYMANFVSETVKKHKKPFVIDLICPYHLEDLEFSKFQFNGDSKLCNVRYLQSLDSVKEQIEIGDFFICGSEKQRDYWLGMLSAENRFNHDIYENDKDFKNLLDIVPFGIPATPPVHKKQMIKGAWKNIRKRDFLILWGGGLWNWFDPLTVIKAMAEIRKKQKNIKLIFIGVNHPNKNNPIHKMTKKAMELSKSLGLLDENVFFYPDRVPYQERENYLLESDIGVISHFDHIENRFSFRTRIMDYFWAGLPVITTKGDCMSYVVEKEALGIVVDYEDVKGWVDSILTLYKSKKLREKCRKNIGEFSKKHTWNDISKPLIEFCRNAGERKKINEKKVILNRPFPIEDLLKNKMVKKILVLRSSPFPQYFDSLNLVKKMFKDAQIEMIVQKETEEVVRKKYPRNQIFTYTFKNFDKGKITKDAAIKELTKKEYDLLIYTTNSYSGNGYKNVEDFGFKFNSKFYLALNRKGCFYRIEQNNN